MSVQVIRPGMLSVIQDGGRTGYRAQGIGPGGVMDDVAYRLANALAGNAAPLPVLEFFQTGPELYFETDALVSVTGFGSRAYIGEVAVSCWHPVLISAGSVLRMESGSGGPGYLAVHGGWKADSWLGSSATHLTVGLGGFGGRALRKGDQLNLVGSTAIRGEGTSVLRWSVSTSELDIVYDRERHVLCLPAPESQRAGASVCEKFASQVFRVGRDSNRMGYRLTGEPLIPAEAITMLSSPVTFGTVQLLPGGQLIVLMADHQTTGGYPRLANVVRTELPRFAHLTDGRPFYFSWCRPEMAIQLLTAREHWLAQVERSCLLHLGGYIYTR